MAKLRRMRLTSTPASSRWTAELCLLYLQRHRRHSFAVQLLKKGTPLKTIGDILGHRTAESTAAYLRLATGDLREVSLPIPQRLSAVVKGARG